MVLWRGSRAFFYEQYTQILADSSLASCHIIVGIANSNALD